MVFINVSTTGAFISKYTVEYVMGKRHGVCQWCNKIERLTTHHVKNRLGDKEEFYGRNNNIRNIMMWVCRSCHNEIEMDYELVGKVYRKNEYEKETTLGGIEHNIPVRMKYMKKGKMGRNMTKRWLEKKIFKVYRKSRHDRSCHIGLYYTQYNNTKKYRITIMKLAIALNETRLIYSKV